MPSRPPLPFVLTAALLALLTGVSMAQSPAEPTGSGVPQTEADAQAEETHVDEHGRRYRIVEYPKGKEGVDYLRQPDGQVRIRFGVSFEVVRETEESFFLKVYIPEKPDAKATPMPPDPPPAEVKVEPPPVWPTVDRIEFSPFDDGLPRRGQWRDGFDIADMDGDGRLDIAFGPTRKGRSVPNLFLHQGDGSWRRWPARFPGFLYDYGSAAAADFNRDGHMDLALAIHLRGVLVLVGDGEGRFRAWSEGIGLAGGGSAEDARAFSSRAIRAVDWDGDGWIDLMVLGEGPRAIGPRSQSGEQRTDSRGLLLYRNRGDGSWEARHDGSINFGESLALGDLDGDGSIDVVTASKVQKLDRLLQMHQEDDNWAARPLTGLRPGSFVFAVEAADLDGDGRDDLLVGGIFRDGGEQRTVLDAFFASEDGAWQRVALFAVAGRTGIYALATGDVDGDGRADVVLGTGDGELQVLLGAEERAFVLERSPEIQQERRGCRAHGLRLADLDGDGADELAAGFAGEPAGLELIYTVPGCLDGGSLRVWRPHEKRAGQPGPAR